MVKKTIKLLKKYDVFDVISIGIFFLIVATLAFFFLRRTKYTVVTLRTSSSDTLLEMNYAKSPSWYIEKIEIGLKEKNLLGKTNIEIIDVLYYPSNNDDKTVFIKMKMEAVYNKNNNQYTYNGTPLLIGSFQNFKFGGVKIQGVVHSIGEKKEEYKVYKITGEFENKYNENIKYQTSITNRLNITNQSGISSQANITNQGLLEYLYKNITINTNLYDNKNNLIFKISNMKLDPAYKEFIGNSQVRNTLDHKRKRVFIDAFILAKKVHNEFLFREQDHLQIDNLLPIHTDTLSLNLTILEIKEATNKEAEELFSQIKKQ